MEKYNWITWVFSGIGVSIIIWIANLFVKRKQVPTINMAQKSGKNSENYQANGNIYIGGENEKPGRSSANSRR